MTTHMSAILHPRVVKFLESIVEDGTWQYDDGGPMTDDVRQFLAHLDNIDATLAAIRHQSVDGPNHRGFNPEHAIKSIAWLVTDLPLTNRSN